VSFFFSSFQGAKGEAKGKKGGDKAKAPKKGEKDTEEK
jgi:hypothetical protein